MTSTFTLDALLSPSFNNTEIVRVIAARLKQDDLRVWFGQWVLKPDAARGGVEPVGGKESCVRLDHQPSRPITSQTASDPINNMKEQTKLRKSSSMFGCGGWLVIVVVAWLGLMIWDKMTRIRIENERERAERAIRESELQELSAYLPGKFVVAGNRTPGSRSFSVAEEQADRYSRALVDSTASLLHQALTHPNRDQANEPDKSMVREMRKSVRKDWLEASTPPEQAIQTEYEAYLADQVARGTMIFLESSTTLLIKEVARDGDPRDKILRCEIVSGANIGENVFVSGRLVDPKN